MKHFKLGVLILYHPNQTFGLIKRFREKPSPFPMLILPLLTIFIRFLYIYTVCYSFAAVRPINANLVVEALRIVLPLLLWVFCSYGLLTLMSGESKLTEALTATCYCLVPYIVLTPVTILLSYIISSHDASIFYGIEMLVFVWVGLLVLNSLRVLNDISVTKSLLFALLTVIFIMIVCAALFLVMALVSQVFVFFSGFYDELRFLNR